MNEVTVGIIGLLALFPLFAVGLEMGFSMMLVGSIGFACLTSPHAGMIMAGNELYGAIVNYGFVVFPLFMLMGQLGYHAGIAGRLYGVANKWVGHIPGGLAMGTVVAAMGFKAVCGSGAATTATFASVAVPEMDALGYDKRLSTGLVASAGAIGAIMPPSITLILFGIITEQSIGKLFMGGIIPSLLMALLCIGVIYGWSRINPGVASPRTQLVTWRQRWTSLPELAWVLIIFGVVVGGITKGYFTATEGGGIGTLAVLLMCIVKKEITLKTYIVSMTETLRTVGMITVLLAGSFMLGRFLSAANIPAHVSEWLVGLPINRYLIMILILLFYQIGGSFIDDIAFMILATPVLFPAVVKLGFDPIWFGIMVGVQLVIGSVIPPVAINVFITKNITKVPINVIYRGVYPFLIAFVVVAALILLFPQLVLWLPSLFFD
jgi:C4-dicarboxylate transporter, DctM subunit